MMTREMPYGIKCLMQKKTVFIIPLIILTSCSGSDVVHTPCEERCEYARLDCVQDCGGYDRAGFSFEIGENRPFVPFSCTDRCDERAALCRSRCEAGK